MAVETGLGWTTLSVDDASGTPCDIRSSLIGWQVATPRAIQDVTSLANNAMKRLQLLADMSVTGTGAFDDEAGKAHSVYKTVSSTDVARTTTLAISGQTLAAEILYTDYALNRAQDGSFGFTVPGVLASGLVPTWS